MTPAPQHCFPAASLRLPTAYLLWVLSSLVLGMLFLSSRPSHAQVSICQANCNSAERLTGPFQLLHTKQHPWKQTGFPTKLDGFCKLGCQLFYAEFPRNTTCKRMCDYYYRYQVTVGYNDLAEQAISECRDGCDIALQICQPGFYCPAEPAPSAGEMLPCAPGSYRLPVQGLGIVALKGVQQCTLCPPGRYRAEGRGKTPDDCAKCPIGKYANIPGSVLVSDCKRCPAGKVAEQAGMPACKCMTDNGQANSCDQGYYSSNNPDTTRYYLPDATGYFVDFYRETSPYIGRW